MTIPNPFIIMAHFDLIGLSTEEKPVKVKNGSTYFEVDTSNLYVFYKGTWYLQGEEEETTSEETTSSVQSSSRLNEVISIPKELGKVEILENAVEDPQVEIEIPEEQEDIEEIEDAEEGEE